MIPFEVRFMLVTAINGASPQFTLTCISTGGPATNVTWTRDNVTITEGIETVLNDPETSEYTHTLTVTGRREGLYRCIVANNKPSQSSVQLNVQGKIVSNFVACKKVYNRRSLLPELYQSCLLYLIKICSVLYAWLYNTAPSPPSEVSISQNGLDSILVSWTVSGESIVTGYIISYQQQDGVHTDSVTVDDTAVTSTIITGLMIGATYSISIVATSNTLPSTETTDDITIGNMITAEYHYQCG